MSDRLTQLQICLDQLVEQFTATVNYVNTNAESALLDPENPTSASNLAANAPLPGHAQPQQLNQTTTQPSPVADNSKVNNEQNEEKFKNTINELSTDIILKSRQISMLIDSLPGIGVTPESQLQLIQELSDELKQVEQERIEKIKQKDQLLAWCEELITAVATGISETRR
ncbi:mediator of RNA polymerase II transcription subunit 21 [Spathaspora passalidarum NRRL Y-27907]|uniref:Mediator of RNA polymerase II transcription subunit 21 n=1 Tax=Spathaspora passalidarum (strain NRRL Y-27907 / 11-Y1) TaxID=619300 RepID=G3AIX7_SPAPN|nr:mediator of RNA polymerase II transcription subunit 21 [Spathaspora passalidarum NRRL Y-27907]EGW33788.1 mediator of RNA polymerase II transcription subunit 21 [Spathaspora passalidarum NRRL Y-27907]